MSYMTRQREQVTITLPPEVLTWLDSKVKDRTFAHRSHGIEVTIRRMMEAEKEQAREHRT